MTERRKKKSGVFVWGVMALLVLGLGGFGLTGAFRTAGGSTVATVGSEDISANEYLNRLQQDVRRASQQYGQNLTIDQARVFGLDQSSLRRQLTSAALTDEAKRLNLSVGDETVRKALMDYPAFQGAGGFSEASYDLVLNQQHMTRAEFEALLRNDQTQNLLSTALSDGIPAQTTASGVLMDYIGESRSVTWGEISASVLPDETPAPDEAAIQAYYEANPEAFTIPETRKLTYAMLTPAMLAENIEIDEAAIQEVYDSRAEYYHTPERRIIDRIIFASQDEAAAAMARIDAGEATFEDIAKERGLTSDEYAIGVVRATQLAAPAAALVFASQEPGIYGPVQDTLGPAIIRVNAVLDASTVSLDEARDDIRATLAAEKASTLMLTKIGAIDDLIASGASLEELANETEMQLFTLDYNTNSTDDITKDPAFTAEATAAGVDEERDLVELENGGILALRVDEITPAKLQTLEEAHNQAVAGAKAEATQARVLAYANELVAQIKAGADLSATLAALGAEPHNEAKVTRANTPADLPPLIGQDLFSQAEGEAKAYETPTGAIIAQINAITPFDRDSDQGKSLMQQMQTRIDTDLASDIYILYANGVLNTAEVVVNQGMINQILANYGGGN